MGLFSGLIGTIGGALGAFGSKPGQQQAQQVDIGTTLQGLNRANAGVLPGAESLTGDVNAFMQSQKLGQLQRAAPGFADVMGGNLTSWARGELSPELAANVGRVANSRAFAGGFGGSPAASALEARNYGLTGLDLQRLSGQMAPSFASLTTAPLVSPTSQMATPQEALSTSTWNAQNAQDVNYLNARLAAGMDPSTGAMMAGLGDLFDSGLQTGVDIYGMTGGRNRYDLPGYTSTIYGSPVYNEF